MKLLSISQWFRGVLWIASVTGAAVAQVPSALPVAPLATNIATGDLAPVHDPSLWIQDGRWYVFSTDPPNPRPGVFLPIRCSADGLEWRRCGQVFTEFPVWVQKAVPGVRNLWAPDISYFNGLYHVYYVGSLLGTQESVIGLATNATLDPNDPKYAWIDHGQVMRSKRGDDFNAIDPNVLADVDGRVWMTYGSYWSGIKQREIDPATGMMKGEKRYDLARRPGVPGDPEEGASMVRHGAYYYLFLSIDHCCERDLAQDDYKEVVGRATTPHGPFYGVQGRAMMDGGGAVLLKGEGDWAAPGGGTAYVGSGGDWFVFHALDLTRHGVPSLWLKPIHWVEGWPVL